MQNCLTLPSLFSLPDLNQLVKPSTFVSITSSYDCETSSDQKVEVLGHF
jgi:hypothetical protein